MSEVGGDFGPLLMMTGRSGGAGFPRFIKGQFAKSK